MKYAIGCLIVLVVLLLIVGGAAAGTYNSLVNRDQAVQNQWGNVQNAYQRRLDLVPNLVETVKGAASFEKETFTQVTEARAKAGQVSSQVGGAPPASQAELDKLQQAQAGLGNALSRLMVVVERYPELKATQNFRDLQAQLEGTENRIAVERMRYNEAAQGFNTSRQSFPTVLWAGFFGKRFDVKPYFKAQEGAETAPKVKF